MWQEGQKRKWEIGSEDRRELSKKKRERGVDEGNAKGRKARLVKEERHPVMILQAKECMRYKTVRVVLEA